VFAFAAAYGAEWITLFDGTSTAAFTTPGGRAFPSECWRIEQGSLVPRANNDVACRSLDRREVSQFRA
jgi:hypothetical protein